MSSCDFTYYVVFTASVGSLQGRSALRTSSEPIRFDRPAVRTTAWGSEVMSRTPVTVLSPSQQSAEVFLS